MDNKVSELQKQLLSKKIETFFTSIDCWSEENYNNAMTHLTKVMKIKQKDAERAMVNFMYKKRPWSEMIKINDSKTCRLAEASWKKFKNLEGDELMEASLELLKWVRESFPSAGDEYSQLCLRRMFVVEYVFQKYDGIISKKRKND